MQLHEQSLQCYDAVKRLLSEAPWSADQISRGYRPFLGTKQAWSRAKMVSDDAVAIGINWPLSTTTIEIQEQMSVPYYEIPGSDFGMRIEHGDKPETLQAHGIGLNWGSLSRLARASEIGHTLFPSGWPLMFKDKLRNPKDHLSFIEEIIWLSTWHDISDIESEVPVWSHLGSNKTVDWRFKSCGQIINLEVKYRARDWVRHVDGPEFTIVKPSYYNDVEGKFQKRNPNELNIVAISSYANPDRSWREETEEFLIQHPQVDAVVLWAPSFASGEDSSPFEVQSGSSKPLIETLLKHSEEDCQHLVVVRHPWKQRDARRSMRVGESQRMLSHYADRAAKRV